MLAAQKAGCYGIVADNKDQQQQIELPLKKLNYDVELSQCLAYLQTQQIYFNQSNKILNVQYVFPVYPNAAIVNFQISFNGHTSKGIVKSKEQAEKEFKQNLDQGREVGYGGYYNRMSKDIMKVKLGNVNPNEEIKVKVCYVHTVGVTFNTFYEFRLSTTITPRYVSRAAAENQVQFINNKVKHVSGVCVWFLNIKIKSRRELKKFFSTTNRKVSADKLDQNTYQIHVNETNMKPDRDFNLYYTFQNFDKPVCMLGQSDHVTQAIVSFVPRFCNLELGDAERRAIQNKQYPVTMSKTKGEYIFFLDRSGSMGGERISKAKEALIIFLKSLPISSYFNIVSFGSQSELLFSQSQKYQAKSINQTLQKVKEMDADMGGTQILDAIKKCMQLPPIPDYSRQIFLLTDGSVQNTSSVVAYAALHTQFTRYHCIGIGQGCSQDLIINCAEKGKGCHMFISDQEDPSEKIVQILEKSLSPVICKMNVQISGGAQSIVPNPNNIPYVLKNQLANFYITFNGKLNSTATATIKYSDSLGQNYSQKIDISHSDALVCNYINKMVSFTSINTLYNIYKYKQKTEDHMFFVKEIKKEELANQIIKQSVEKQILTQLTAFICVDSSKADEITKSHIKEQKEVVNIHPMNPADHVLHVNFGTGFDDSDSGSDLYIDECCVVEMELPQSSSGKKQNLLFQKRKTIEFKVIDRSSQDGIKNFLIKLKDPPRQLLQFIQKQQLNGVWVLDELLNSVYNPKEIQDIKSVFNSYPKEIWGTLSIIKNIELFFKDTKKKATLILRKAKEYIDNNIGQKYLGVQTLWNTKVRNQELSNL